MTRAIIALGVLGILIAVSWSVRAADGCELYARAVDYFLELDSDSRPSAQERLQALYARDPRRLKLIDRAYGDVLRGTSSDQAWRRCVGY